MAQPLYMQIAEDLRQQIDSGALARDSELPTELELRVRYNASRNTVRDALTRLVGQGLIEHRPGQGTFVAKQQDPFVTVLTAYPKVGVGEGATYLDDVSAKNREASASVQKVELQTSARDEVTRRLRVPVATQVVRRHETRCIDDNSWSLQTSFYPMEFITKGTCLPTAEDIEGGAVLYLAETMGLRQVGYRDWITGRNPDSNEHTFLRITHHAATFEIFRTVFDHKKKPMWVTVTGFPADWDQFIVNVGDVSDPPYETDAGAAETLQIGPLDLPARPAA